MPVGSSSIDFSRPLIRSKYDFPGKTSKITTTLNSHSPLASQVSRHLFSLGIVVLELALGKTVEDLYPNASWIMDFGNITDRNIEDLLESVKNKVNFHEEKAIISCMGLCPRLRIKSIIRNDVLPELYRTSTEMSHAPDQLEDSAKSYKVLHISLLHQVRVASPERKGCVRLPRRPCWRSKVDNHPHPHPPPIFFYEYS